MRNVTPLVRCVIARRALTAAAQAQEYPITPVPLTAVRFTDRFWAPYDVLERTLYNGYLSGVSLAMAVWVPY